MKTCERCGGTGISETNDCGTTWDEECPDCGGAGKQMETYDAGPGSRNRKLPPPTDNDHLLEIIAQLTGRMNALEQRVDEMARRETIGKTHTGAMWSG